jgi:hypothetical protein
LLAAEHLNVPPPAFEKYWEALSAQLPAGAALSGKEAGVRLNRQRVLFKHHGGSSSSNDVEQAVADVAAFIAANTPIVFGVDYETISLTMVVPQDEVRSRVQAAEAEAASGDLKAAMVSLRTAFDELFGPARAHASLRRALAVPIRTAASG